MLQDKVKTVDNWQELLKAIGGNSSNKYDELTLMDLEEIEVSQ